MSAPNKWRREIGELDSGSPGPTCVVLGGVHGNEPAGAAAAERVLEISRSSRLRPRGRLLALRGNLPGLEAGQRFIDEDLNRIWIREDIEKSRRADRRTVEREEQLDLLRIFEALERDAVGPIIFLDLHTTSAHGSPFAGMVDTLRNREVAFILPCPIILGLDEYIPGTLLSFLHDRGHVGIVVEGGQHRDSGTVDILESAIWLTLVSAGLLRSSQVPEFAEHRQKMRERCRGLPRVVETFYGHRFTPDERFVMRPGFENFQHVKRGDVLAEDTRGLVRAPKDGRLLMPLYQGEGDDGFFMARDISQLYLGASRILRKLPVKSLVSVLPSVERVEPSSDELEAPGSELGSARERTLRLVGYHRRPSTPGEPPHTFVRNPERFKKQ